MKSKVIKQFFCKAHNRRVCIELHYFESEKRYGFRISTKTYKGGRDILIKEQWHSVEMFYLLKDLKTIFCDKETNDLVFNVKDLKAENYVFNEIKKHKDELKNS